MLKSVKMSHLSAGFSTVLIGYASAVIIVIQAASVLGASESQIESWLLTLGLIMGLSSMGLSWRYKTPILTAWSTPSAALLVGVGAQYDIYTATGAFILVGIATLITGLIKPVCKAIEEIPPALGSAMLAAILLPFCMSAFNVAQSAPSYFAILFCALCVSKLIAPKFTMFILLGLSIVLAMSSGAFSQTTFNFSISSFEVFPPEFNVSALLNLAIPLYLVTMLSQNLSGIAMMQSYGYTAPVKPILIGTGVINMMAAQFGGFSLNLAAISAAMCMTEEVDSKKGNRYRAVIWAGLFYILAGLLATSVVSIFVAFPSEVTQMLAGFALLGTLLMCLQSAFSNARYREASLLTFLVTLSGISFLGLNAIIWGLLFGWFYASLMNKKAENS